MNEAAIKYMKKKKNAFILLIVLLFLMLVGYAAYSYFLLSGLSYLRIREIKRAVHGTDGSINVSTDTNASGPLVISVFAQKDLYLLEPEPSEIEVIISDDTAYIVLGILKRPPSSPTPYQGETTYEAKLVNAGKASSYTVEISQHLLGNDKIRRVMLVQGYLDVDTLCHKFSRPFEVSCDPLLSNTKVTRGAEVLQRYFIDEIPSVD